MSDRLAAERMRRWRARQRAGIIILRVRVNDADGTFTDALISTGRVPRALSDHSPAIEAAAGRLLEQWADRVTRNDADPLGSVPWREINHGDPDD